MRHPLLRPLEPHQEEGAFGEPTPGDAVGIGGDPFAGRGEFRFLAIREVRHVREGILPRHRAQRRHPVGETGEQTRRKSTERRQRSDTERGLRDHAEGAFGPKDEFLKTRSMGISRGRLDIDDPGGRNESHPDDEVLDAPVPIRMGA